VSLDDLAIEYQAELPTAQEFERLFRSSGWSEASEVPADRLAATTAGRLVRDLRSL